MAPPAYVSRRDDAIIERKPYVLFVRDHDSTTHVYFYASATPLEAPPQCDAGSSHGPTFERVRDDVRGAAAAWPTEPRVLRDEPDQILLHFLRAPEESGTMPSSP